LKLSRQEEVDYLSKNGALFMEKNNIHQKDFGELVLVEKKL
jgi:hypothetical protein